LTAGHLRECNAQGVVRLTLTIKKMVDLLIESDTKSLDEPRWIIDGKRNYGFAHGMAGIAYSLAQFQRIAEDIRIRRLLTEITEFYETTYTPSGWPKSPDNDERWMAWCHGLPGILLSLLEIGMIYPRAIELATHCSESMESACTWPPHCLCHGSLSAIWAYEALFRITGIPNYRAIAKNACKLIVSAQYNRNVHVQTWRNDRSIEGDASLMTGGTGLAYLILEINHNLPLMFSLE